MYATSSLVVFFGVLWCSFKYSEYKEKHSVLNKVGRLLSSSL